MTDKPIYHMSSVGDCPRILGANRLGHEPIPQAPDDLARLNHYSRMEALAAQQIMDLGYSLEPSSLCQTCKERYNSERHGIHVEVDTALFLLVGHLDRRLVLNDNHRLPVEIKSLGKVSWAKFDKNGFDSFGNYAAQECCYLEAEKLPGIYWCMNRDSGEPLKYIVNDTQNDINLDGFEHITLPITFDQIVDKLNQIEISVQEGMLPESEEREDCYFCRFKFLCVKPEEKNLKLVTQPPLVEAASMYKEALEMEGTAKEMKETARDTLLAYAKGNKVDRYKVLNLSISYRGQKTKEYIDTGLFKSHHPDMYKLYVRLSAPYDDYTIRRLKE